MKRCWLFNFQAKKKGAPVFFPPLTIGTEEVNTAVEILKVVFREISEQD